MANKVLVLLAHPALETSVTNRRLARAVTGLDGVRVHDLYETYPDFEVDVAREQDLLREHDVIVFQHPFYWYSAPALIKEWLDLVLEHGFAYGRTGNALRGKVMMNAFSTGGREEAYGPDGRNRFTVRQLLAPFDQTAHLCHMIYYPPFVVYRGRGLPRQALAEAAATYRRCIEALRDGTLRYEQIADLPRINGAADSLDGQQSRTS